MKTLEQKAIEIAKLFHAGDLEWNKGGWPSNSLGGASKDKPPAKANDIHSIEDLYNALLIHGPIYGCYYEEGIISHMVVITGVNLTEGIVYTNNPWGVYGAQSFQAFLKGFAACGGDFLVSSSGYVYIA